MGSGEINLNPAQNGQVFYQEILLSFFLSFFRSFFDLFFEYQKTNKVASWSSSLINNLNFIFSFSGNISHFSFRLNSNEPNSLFQRGDNESILVGPQHTSSYTISQNTA